MIEIFKSVALIICTYLWIRAMGKQRLAKREMEKAIQRSLEHQRKAETAELSAKNWQTKYFKELQK
jgi:hypothetical protein